MKGSLSLIALFLEWCDQAHTLLPFTHCSSTLSFSLSSYHLPPISLAPRIHQIADAEHQTDTQINVSLSPHPPSIPGVTLRLETAACFCLTPLLSVRDVILRWREVSAQQIADL